MTAQCMRLEYARCTKRALQSRVRLLATSEALDDDCTFVRANATRSDQPRALDAESQPRGTTKRVAVANALQELTRSDGGDHRPARYLPAAPDHVNDESVDDVLRNRLPRHHAQPLQERHLIGSEPDAPKAKVVFGLRDAHRLHERHAEGLRAELGEFGYARHFCAHREAPQGA